MEHLFKILNQTYPNKEWLIRVTYERAKGAVTAGLVTEYLLYVEDRESVSFDSMDALENYIFDLYKHAALREAEDIINGVQPTETDLFNEEDAQDLENNDE